MTTARSSSGRRPFTFGWMKVVLKGADAHWHTATELVATEEGGFDPPAPARRTPRAAENPGSAQNWERKRKG
jgi:hypothetical protein